MSYRFLTLSERDHSSSTSFSSSFSGSFSLNSPADWIDETRSVDKHLRNPPHARDAKRSVAVFDMYKGTEICFKISDRFMAFIDQIEEKKNILNQLLRKKVSRRGMTDQDEEVQQRLSDDIRVAVGFAQGRLDTENKLVKVIWDFATATDEVRLYMRYGDYLANHLSDFKQEVNNIMHLARQKVILDAAGEPLLDAPGEPVKHPDSNLKFHYFMTEKYKQWTDMALALAEEETTVHRWADMDTDTRGPEPIRPIHDAIKEVVTKLPDSFGTYAIQLTWEIKAYANRNRIPRRGIDDLITDGDFGSLARELVIDLSYVNRTYYSPAANTVYGVNNTMMRTTIKAIKDKWFDSIRTDDNNKRHIDFRLTPHGEKTYYKRYKEPAPNFASPNYRAPLRSAVFVEEIRIPFP